MKADKSRRVPEAMQKRWMRHDIAWRNPNQVIAQWAEGDKVDAKGLSYRVKGAWWDILSSIKATLLITREYEHLITALTVKNGRPLLSYMRVPHPSGLVVDESQKLVRVVLTRNPNQLMDLAPATGTLDRSDIAVGKPCPVERPLVPVLIRFFPGCLYLHDLALIGGELHGNAVGLNAVVHLGDGVNTKRVWWPRCIERRGRPDFGCNYIQMNSIAGGDSLMTSFFSASTDQLLTRKPGHKNFPVDKRGVVFSGSTREAIARGLTRPHSVRMHDAHIWVDNSGYGEVGVVEDGGFAPLTRLPGWTRGLAFSNRIAFVGTSRVIPRFSCYAPGLDMHKSICGVHAVDCITGEVLGSIVWPFGNQIFAVEIAHARLTEGFPFIANVKGVEQASKRLFYSFVTHNKRKKRNEI